MQQGPSVSHCPTFKMTEHRKKQLPPELIGLIIETMPRSALPTLAQVSRAWYDQAMPRLYHTLYICTRHHWHCLVDTMERIGPWAGQFVHSLVLNPSPPLYPTRVPSYRQDLPPGYDRDPVDLERTGLEDKDENYAEIDNTQKEAEWLTTVTDQQVAAVVSHCPNLAYLDLSGCEKLGDGAVGCIQNPDRLHGLWLPLARNLTSSGLSTVVCDNKHLTHLDLSFCRYLSDDVLVRAVTKSPFLTHLRLTSLYDVTDATIFAIATSCPHLTLLHLVRCWQVTNDGLVALADSCKNLQYVSVAFLSRANEEGIGRLVSRLPKLQWLDITGCGINSLFKSMIIETWSRQRDSLRLGRIEFQDGNVPLL